MMGKHYREQKWLTFELKILPCMSPQFATATVKKKRAQTNFTLFYDQMHTLTGIIVMQYWTVYSV